MALARKVSAMDSNNCSRVVVNSSSGDKRSNYSREKHWWYRNPLLKGLKLSDRCCENSSASITEGLNSDTSWQFRSCLTSNNSHLSALRIRIRLAWTQQIITRQYRYHAMFVIILIAVHYNIFMFAVFFSVYKTTVLGEMSFLCSRRLVIYLKS